MLIKTNERSLFNVPFLTIFNFLFAYSLLCGILQSSLEFPVIGECMKLCGSGTSRNSGAALLEQTCFPLPQCLVLMNLNWRCIPQFNPSQDILTSVYFLNSLELKLSCLYVYFSPSHFEKKNCIFNIKSTKSKLPRRRIIREKSLHSVSSPLDSGLSLVCAFLSFPHLQISGRNR